MARRMDVELTSDRGDGTWTWRAAGARQPRGVIEAAMVGAGARVGDVLRVEAEIELDGLTIVAVLPQRTASPRKGLIEVSGSTPAPTDFVTTSLLPRHERRGPRFPGERRSYDGDGRRPPRSTERSSERRSGDSPGERSGGSPGERSGGSPGERSGGSPDQHRGERDGASRRPPRPAGTPYGRSVDGSTAAGRPPRPSADSEAGSHHGRPSERAGAAAERPGRDGRPTQHADGQSQSERARRSRSPRFVPGTAHRDALLDTLPTEQRPIAEQLALGGLPAVRRALAEERAAATAAGLPAASGDAIVAIAEQLLPAVRSAVWLDRAEAAERIIDEISLRDLRAAVAGAIPRDEHSRELLRKLREALEARMTRLREGWELEMTHRLEEGRVLQALRQSSKPPVPNTRFPAALVNRLAEAAGTAMTATTAPERWLDLLEAASVSPVGRLVKPSGVPDDAALRKAAAQAAGRIPALAPLLGLAMPPPPRPSAAIPGRRSFGVPAARRIPGRIAEGHDVPAGADAVPAGADAAPSRPTSLPGSEAEPGMTPIGGGDATSEVEALPPIVTGDAAPTHEPETPTVAHDTQSAVASAPGAVAAILEPESPLPARPERGGNGELAGPTAPERGSQLAAAWESTVPEVLQTSGTPGEEASAIADELAVNELAAGAPVDSLEATRDPVAPTGLTGHRGAVESALDLPRFDVQSAEVTGVEVPVDMPALEVPVMDAAGMHEQPKASSLAAAAPAVTPDADAPTATDPDEGKATDTGTTETDATETGRADTAAVDGPQAESSGQDGTDGPASPGTAQTAAGPGRGTAIGDEAPDTAADLTNRETIS